MNLDIKIDLMKPVDNNGPVDNMIPELEVAYKGIWACKIRLLGSEAGRLGVEYNTVRVNFIVRVRNDINENMYIKHNDNLYNIIGFEKIKDEENYMLIATVKKAADMNVNEDKI